MNASTTGRLLVTMAILLAGCGSPSPPRPTNVVLITIDALRADFVSYSGHTHETTPNLDALAQESAVFSQALTSFPGTTPSMPSLMSGLYPNFEDVDVWNQTTHFGFNDLETPGSEDATTLTDNLRMLAEILSEHGYLTVGFNTNPHLGSANNFSQGFEEYESFWDYPTKFKQWALFRLVIPLVPGAALGGVIGANARTGSAGQTRWLCFGVVSPRIIAVCLKDRMGLFAVGLTSRKNYRYIQ